MKKIIVCLTGLILICTFHFAMAELAVSSNYQTGKFATLPISGLNFKTPTHSGVTNTKGEFVFNENELIEFSLGAIKFEKYVEINASNEISIYSLTYSTHTEDDEFLNMVNLLQSIDEDLDISNGIEINQDIQSAFKNSTVSFVDDNFEQMVNVTLAPFNRALLSKTQSMQKLVDHFYPAFDCASEHERVGQSGKFKTLHHRVSGTISMLNDCTLRIINFSYDAKGPDAFLYASKDGDYKNGQAISEILRRGKAYKNEVLLLKVDSLTDLNAISVWCKQFSVNFGDAIILK